MPLTIGLAGSLTAGGEQVLLHTKVGLKPMVCCISESLWGRTGCVWIPVCNLRCKRELACKQEQKVQQQKYSGFSDFQTTSEDRITES